MNILKIVIKGYSGFGCFDEGYEEVLTITKSKISFLHKPASETPVPSNTFTKWSYKSESETFKCTYEIISAMVLKILEREEIDAFDAEGTEFIITLGDKSKIKRLFWGGQDYFEECFNVIKTLIPPCEKVPRVIMTKEDYDSLDV